MSHQEKLEQALEFLINEEQDKARALLHDVIVGKSRSIYEELEAAVEQEVDETYEFGGDKKDDFVSKIERDEDEVDSEEYMESDDEDEDDMEMDGEEMPMDMDGEEMPMDMEMDGEVSDEEEVEDRVEDLESKLAELSAKFDELMADEMEEPEHQDMEMSPMGDDMDSAYDDDPENEGYYEAKSCDDEDEDALEEATKLQDEVGDLGMDQEGKYSGTGQKSQAVSIDKESPYTHAAAKPDHGGKPHVIKDGGDGDQKPMPAKKDDGFGAKDNIDVDHKSAPEAEKDPKHDDKSAKSTLGQK